MDRAIGLVAVAFTDVARGAFTRTAELGFDHLDVPVGMLDELDDDALATLPVPIGDRIARAGATGGVHVMALTERRDEDRFDETVTLFRQHPGRGSNRGCGARSTAPSTSRP